MAKGVSDELKAEIHKVLGELVIGEQGSRINTHVPTERLRMDAIHHLNDIGALRALGSNLFQVTAYGREHWESLNTWTPWYWFKRNWFPAIVAFMTILASVTGAIANFVS